MASVKSVLSINVHEFKSPLKGVLYIQTLEYYTALKKKKFWYMLQQGYPKDIINAKWNKPITKN